VAYRDCNLWRFPQPLHTKNSHSCDKPGVRIQKAQTQIVREHRHRSAAEQLRQSARPVPSNSLSLNILGGSLDTSDQKSFQPGIYGE
jgi:hypothetical protein